MNTTASVVLTGVVVTAGRWSKGQGITTKVVVGAGFLTVALAAMSQVNAGLAQQFGLLVLIGAVLVYGVDIAKKTGLAK
jgi:hypothetical protein